MEEVLKKLKEHRDEHRRKVLFECENDFDRGVYCGIDLAIDLLKKLNQAEVINSVCQICGEPLDDYNIYGKCVKCYFEELEAN